MRFFYCYFGGGGKAAAAEKKAYKIRSACCKCRSL